MNLEFWKERAGGMAFLAVPALAVLLLAVGVFAQVGEKPAEKPAATKAAPAPAKAEVPVFPESPDPKEATGAAASKKTPPADTANIALPPESSADEAAADAYDAAIAGKWKPFVIGLTVFTLAVFVGMEVIAKVPPTLHTPLCFGSNAISGITVVGSIVVAGSSLAATETSPSWLRVLATLVGIVAVALAMTNVVGGFLVTHRMLGMFKAKQRTA